jgi:hypothetical protein
LGFSNWPVIFFIKFIHHHRATRGAVVSHFKEVWRAWVPPRVRVFMWQLIADQGKAAVQ